MDADAMIRRALTLILALVISAPSEGPQYGHSDANTQLEFENVYNDLRNTGTSDPLTLSSATIAALTVGSSMTMNGKKITNLANGTASTDAAAFGQLKFIQYVSTTAVGAQTTNSQTFVNSTLSTTITPTSSASKILIIAKGELSIDNATRDGMATIARNTTEVTGSIRGLSFVSGGVQTVPVTLVYLDSPATTSQTRYTVQYRISNSANNCTWGVNDVRQFMILIEVAG